MTFAKLAVIDDEEALATFVAEVTKQAGFVTEKFFDGGTFKSQYDKNLDIIILDLLMPGIDGIEIIRFLADMECQAQIILMSGFDTGVLQSAETLVLEQGLNFMGSLTKPFRTHELLDILNEFSNSSDDLNATDHIPRPTKEELVKAIQNNELVVYYQPKADLKNNTNLSVEALVRWVHPEHGLIPPDFFIPLAVEYNLIDDLTWVVLKTALSQCKAWKDQGLTVLVAINMSAEMLKELDIPERIGSLIAENGLDASQIILEITESQLMKELITSLDILTRLRMKGIGLSIDDFGTGYSSLLQLHRVPFSEMKVDRSFVSAMDHNLEAASIVESIIMLGHKLGMNIVAEGVETKVSQQRLIELECTHAQGYFIAKPMPANEIFPWFEQYLKNNINNSV